MSTTAHQPDGVLVFPSTGEHDHLLPRTEKGRNTRRALIQAARRSFRERGYQGTRVSKLCADAQLSNGAFYRYFAHKEHLLAVVLEDFLRDIYRSARSFVDPDEDIRQSIYDVAYRYLSVYRDNADLFRAMVEASQSLPQIERLWGVGRDHFFAGLVNLIEFGRGTDQARPCVEADLVGPLLGGMIEYFAYIHFVLKRQNGWELEAIATQIAEVWIHSTFPDTVIGDSHSNQ